MRIVVTKDHEAEGVFLKNKNFVFVSFSSLAPSDYAIPSLAFPLPSWRLTAMIVDVGKGGRRGLRSPSSRFLEGQCLQGLSLSLLYGAP